MLEFSVLGPLLVSRAGQQIDLPAEMWRKLLALLLCQPGTPIDVDTIVDQLWPADPPRTARKALQVYVHRLRQALGEPDRIAHNRSGYLLTVDPEELDATRFAVRVTKARSELDSRLAFAILADALGLWRGDAFAGISDVSKVDAERNRLAQLRMSATEKCFAIRLDL